MKLPGGLEQYYKELGKFPTRPSKKNILKLWKKLKKDDKKAGWQLIENYLRLVIPIAKKYQRPGIELSDLIEEGNLGLLHATEKYNPKKKASFSTYATYWVEQYIRRSVQQDSKTIRIPSHVWENFRKYLKIREQLYEQLGRYPTTIELTQKLCLSEKQIKNIEETIDLFHGIGSIDTPLDENGELFLKDTLTDKTIKTPEMIISTLKSQDELDKLLPKLKPRERNILELRYGLKSKKRLTLEEVGKKLHISRERVRQLEKRGLYQLRWTAHKIGLI